MRVYLAGPDVFVPDAAGRAAALKSICARHGLIGVSPLDLFERPQTRFVAGFIGSPQMNFVRRLTQ